MADPLLLIQRTLSQKLESDNPLASLPFNSSGEEKHKTLDACRSL